MAAYYYTKSEEDHPVYHTNQNCDEGKKIESENRVDTDKSPAGRSLCKEC
jgi:hypothetical protein